MQLYVVAVFVVVATTDVAVVDIFINCNILLDVVVSTIKFVDAQFWHFTENCCNLYFVLFFSFSCLFFFLLIFKTFFSLKLHFAPQFMLLMLNNSNLTLSLSFPLFPQTCAARAYGPDRFYWIFEFFRWCTSKNFKFWRLLLLLTIIFSFFYTTAGTNMFVRFFFLVFISLYSFRGEIIFLVTKTKHSCQMWNFFLYI